MRASTCADAGAAAASIAITILFRSMPHIVAPDAAGRMPLVRRRALACIVSAQLIVCGCGQRSHSDARLRFSRAPIVLVSIDTLRADHLAAYGYGAGSTPVLDRLSRHGILFDEGHSQCPLKLPSTTSLVTPQQPLHHGRRHHLR